MSDHSHDNDQHLHIHITPLWVYFTVWIALMILTGITVGAATLSLGVLNIPLMLAIAIVKGSLVAMFFMHLLYDDRFNLLLFLSAIGFIMIFFIFTMIDPMTRGVVNKEDGPKIVPEQFRMNNQFGLTEEYLNVGFEHAPAGSHGHGDAHGAGDHGQSTDPHGIPSAAHDGDPDTDNIQGIGHPAEETLIQANPATAGEDSETVEQPAE